MRHGILAAALAALAATFTVTFTATFAATSSAASTEVLRPTTPQRGTVAVNTTTKSSSAVPGTGSAPQTPTGTGSCKVDPPASPPPAARRLNVRDFGAVGDGKHDDTAALRRALAAMRPGDTLAFGPGRFVHAARLVIATPGARLVADGATLHATNPADQALLIQADGVVVQGFTLTAVTDRRRDAPWQSRIAVWRDAPQPTHDVHILDNRIVEAGPAGSPLANSSSSAAIFVHHATRFTVARNVVRRPLADAIHVTGGSTAGHVVGNTVRESGDDMVAVVSYLPDADEARRGVPTLVRDVLVAGNNLAGQYWGRGITVVGGEAVTIVANRVDAVTHAAAIYLAREAGYRTHGVRDVVVKGNTITRVQTTRPAYAVLEPARRGRRTGHAAIEVVAQVADDERTGAGARDDVRARESFGVRDVRIEGNTVDDVATDGIRIGDGWGRRFTIERVQAGGGTTQPVGATAAPIRGVTLIDNRLSRIGGSPLVVFDAADKGRALACAGNTHGATRVNHPACEAPGRGMAAATVASAAASVVAGSTMRCAGP
jgi:hypothetical protein